VPIGLYYITSDSKAPFVEVCPPGPLGPLSVHADTVDLHLSKAVPTVARLCLRSSSPALAMLWRSLNGIKVNGSWIPNTASAFRDSEGRVVPPPLVCVLGRINSQFALDAGGVVEFYPQPRINLRFDAGDSCRDKMTNKELDTGKLRLVVSICTGYIFNGNFQHNNFTDLGESGRPSLADDS
jgi:hypothetical protein